MLLAIIGFTMMTLLVSALITVKIYKRDDSEGALIASGLVIALSAVVLIFTSITWIGMLASYNNIAYNEQRIAMLEEHNQIIEAKIRLVVKDYLEHEEEVYDFDNTSLLVLLIKLPELKSDALVKQELDLYVANSDEIKTLKLQSIDRGIIAWWLWFGVF